MHPRYAGALWCASDSGVGHEGPIDLQNEPRDQGRDSVSRMKTQERRQLSHLSCFSSRLLLICQLKKPLASIGTLLFFQGGCPVCQLFGTRLVLLDKSYGGI